MNVLVALAFLFVIVIISSNIRKQENLKAIKDKNNASFVAEVEEFARWGELVFREYCGIVGVEAALRGLGSGIVLCESVDEFMKCQR